jgi:glutamate racemase
MGAELLVIACNTATALALDRITAAAHVPVVGVVEPGAEAAALVSKNKKVVVIGTEATVSSHAYRKGSGGARLDAREKACPLLVPLVEEGWVEHPVTEQVARIYLDEAFGDGFHDADALVLGCTHYPLHQAAAASRGARACEHCGLGRIYSSRRRRLPGEALAADPGCP